MAQVFQVLDTTSGRRAALKRLRVPGAQGRKAKLVALFEREFLTLAQLAHPRIVEVYDYGVDDEGPYYTMELLDGGDLQALSPAGYRRACALARDVCSALALLHSRRLLYRDLSPHNVRCTSDGAAKLIDFGAMMPMGPSRDLVGTLPFVAPEMVTQRALDARTDLYALGATLYYTLTHRHAYPARDAGQLVELWQGQPRRPSELVPGIPEALDRLVMDLLQIDPAQRPANAAEVMDRLSAIADLPVDDHRLVPQAYLSTPTLVGRTEQLSSLHDLAAEVLKQRGACALIQGSSGVGRSRLLDACVLDAKLAGLMVLRGTAADAEHGDYGVAKALAGQLLQMAREPALQAAAAHAATLGHVLPELLEQVPGTALRSFESKEQQHRATQEALRAWLREVARQRPMIVAVDDFLRSDESSAALLALLSRDAGRCGLLLVATVNTDDPGSSYAHSMLRLLAGSSKSLNLQPLSPEHTERMLSSMFGEVPNLPVVAHHVHRLTGGNPSDITRIAQHLVSEGVVRYQGGAWSLPERLSTADLPAGMGEALRAQIDKLSSPSRALGYVFACEPNLGLSFEDCALIFVQSSHAQLMLALDELVTAEVLQFAGDRYRLAQQAWSGALASALPEAEKLAAHRSLAHWFEQRGDGFRAAQHLLRAGEHETGLDTLLRDAAASERRTDASPREFDALLQSLPSDWLGTYEEGLRLCETYGRPRAQSDALRSRMGGLIAHAVSNTSGYRHVRERLAQLRAASGLDLFAELPATLDHGTRLRTALEKATVRFQQTPEDERVYDPGAAIQQLTKGVLVAIGTIAFTNDYNAWRELPLLAPFTPLSPALAIAHQLAQGVGARISGRSEDAITIYQAMLERLAQPDRGGLDPSHHHHAILRVTASIAALEASMGRASCMQWINKLESDPAYEMLGLQLRHLYDVWQGNVSEAERGRQRLELLAIQSQSAEVAQTRNEGQHLFSELCAHALADDLTQVKRTTDAVAMRAVLHEAWVPVLHYGRGEYHRIRGDLPAAKAELETALRLVEGVPHQIWANVAGAHLRTLLELGSIEEARQLGEAYLKLAEERGLGFVRNYVRLPFALVLSRLGLHAEAASTAEAAISEFLKLGSSGRNLALAYETRALIALEAHDHEGYERHATLSVAQARTRRLRAKQLRAPANQEGTGPSSSQLDERSLVTQFTSSLHSCHTTAERARCGLEFLGLQVGAISGRLYTLTQSGLAESAVFGDYAANPELAQWAHDYFHGEVRGTNATLHESAPPADAAHANSETRPRPRYLAVLLMHEREGVYAATGVAVFTRRSGQAFAYPTVFASELSRHLDECGDALALAM